MENLECTLNEGYFAMKLYRCVDRKEFPVNCKPNVLAIPGMRLIASCSVMINEENVLHTFYCTEHMFNDATGRLSIHYDITFVPSKSQTFKNG